MDRLNINSLFNKKVSNDKSSLNIQTLYNPKLTRKSREITKKVHFNVDNIIIEQEERKKKVINEYKKIFNLCLNKIKTANKINKTDMVFEVPKVIFTCPDYDYRECLEKIEISLRELCMDTLILSNDTIFISWYNIKDNKEKKCKNNKD